MIRLAKYYLWSLTKTRQGGLSEGYHRRCLHMKVANVQLNFKFLELLISKWPQKLKCCGPLYLWHLDSPYVDIWHSSQPVGIDN